MATNSKRNGLPLATNKRSTDEQRCRLRKLAERFGYGPEEQREDRGVGIFLMHLMNNLELTKDFVNQSILSSIKFYIAGIC